MIEVKAKYINVPNKNETDYFIFTDIEVSGHATNTGYTTNEKVCAGVSACCAGIYRLMNYEQYKVDCWKGYFKCYTNHTKKLKHNLDRDSVYALNTLVCQLFEIYNSYPNAFKSFELVEVKEIDDGKQPTKQKREPFRKRRNHLGIHSLIEEPHFKEN